MRVVWWIWVSFPRCWAAGVKCPFGRELSPSCEGFVAIKRSLSGDRGHTCWGWIASLPSTHLPTKLQTHLHLESYTPTERIIPCVQVSFHILHTSVHILLTHVPAPYFVAPATFFLSSLQTRPSLSCRFQVLPLLPLCLFRLSTHMFLNCHSTCL